MDIMSLKVQSASNPRYTCPTDGPVYLVLSRLSEHVYAVLGAGSASSESSRQDYVLSSWSSERKRQWRPGLAGRNVDNQVYGRFPRALLGVYLDW